MNTGSGIAYFTSPEHRLITLTGAGGKTSLMAWIAALFRAIPHQVILTSTTKILPLPGEPFLLEDESPDFLGRVRQALDQSRSITLASRLDESTGKLIGLSRATVSALYEAKLADTIICEADGAARKALKAPADHEPVIPAETDLCIGVMGLDACGKPLTEANVHRHGIFSHVTGLQPGRTIQPRHMARLAASADGLFKGCPAHAELCVFLNKADMFGRETLIREFMAMTPDERGPAFWFAGSVQNRCMARIDRQAHKARQARNTGLVFSSMF